MALKAGEQRAARRAGRVALIGLAIVLIAAALGWSPLATLAARPTISRDGVAAEKQPDQIYAAPYPRCAEICATIQRCKSAGAQGDPFGHAVICAPTLEGVAQPGERITLARVRGDPARRASRLHIAHIRAQRAEAEALLGRVAALKAERAAEAGQ